MKVLVATHDPEIADSILDSFRQTGIETIASSTGAAVLYELKIAHLDVVILDVGLSDPSGLEVCRQLRQRETPVILLDASAEEGMVERGFEAGADDYVHWPLSPRHLTLRVHAVSRRVGVNLAFQRSPALQIGDYLVSLDSWQLTKGDQVAQLTRSEFSLLWLLVQNLRNVVTYKQMANALESRKGGNSTLATHVHQLRHKIQLIGGDRDLIRTLVGTGYMLDPK